MYGERHIRKMPVYCLRDPLNLLCPLSLSLLLIYADGSTLYSSCTRSDSRINKQRYGRGRRRRTKEEERQGSHAAGILGYAIASCILIILSLSLALPSRTAKEDNTPARKGKASGTKGRGICTLCNCLHVCSLRDIYKCLLCD